jgi:hypothetical protein
MGLSPTKIAVLASFFIIGCTTTPKQQPTPAQTKLEKKDVHEYNQEVEGRVQ